MIDTLINLPISFWVVVAALLTCGVWATARIRDGLGLPVLAVLGTITAWYVVDLFYNGYEYYAQTFSSKIIDGAWWQVALFLILFALFAPQVHRVINARYLNRTSVVYGLAGNGISDPFLQQRITLLFRACLAVWLVLSLIAAIRLGPEIPFYFFPFLSHKADPWSRERIGTGFDSLISVATHLQIFTAACFGIVAALLTNRRTRALAILACAVAWPYFIFDRTRNVMLSSMLPGVLTWVFFRVRGIWVKKVIAVAGFFLLTNLWFGFVIANRTNMSITEALQQKGFDTTNDAHHEGLNMFEELCWINTLIGNGVFQPTFGESYLAELASPIPRALWPGKPTIGLDYAVARGQVNVDIGGPGATISTGMIGQGVVSFGPFWGPACAALLISIWVAILARVDLRGQDVVLYGFGLILTFNLGREITTVTLYTFIFGALLVWCMNRFNRIRSQAASLRRLTARRRPASRLELDVSPYVAEKP